MEVYLIAGQLDGDSVMAIRCCVDQTTCLVVVEMVVLCYVNVLLVAVDYQHSI